MRHFKTFGLASSLLFAACTSPSPRAPAADGATPPPRMQLWNVVRAECLQQQVPSGQASPCLHTDAARNYVLFRDLKSPLHDLVVPLKPVSGIEDPQILQPDAPNYFAEAWNGFLDIERSTQREIPRDEIAAAINPVFQRSQDQLHIHVACMWPDVVTTLRQHLGEFSDWDHSKINLRGKDYRVLVLHQAQLGTTNPFVLLARNLKPGSDPMAFHTLVLIGARFQDGTEGFLLLDRSGTPADPSAVHGEDLQDNTCAVLTQP